MILAVLLLILIALALPILFIVITWEHELLRKYPMLPAPSDLGSREFVWRSYLSPLTRRGWKKAVLGTPCPRITLHCPFALLSTDFAKLTTSLGFDELKLDAIPSVFPQAVLSTLLLQMVGNSNFPASTRHLRVKGVSICHVRSLDMRFPDKEVSTEENPSQLHCLMVLTDKRFLVHELEFTIQTDLLDSGGLVWQSTTHLAVPYTQESLVVPLTESGIRLDQELMETVSKEPAQDVIKCTQRNFDEFESVSVSNLTGHRNAYTPVMWMIGQVMSKLQKRDRMPSLPLLISSELKEEAGRVPIDTCMQVHSWTSSETEKQDVKFQIECDGHGMVNGLLRTVGWVTRKSQVAEEDTETTVV